MDWKVGHLNKKYINKGLKCDVTEGAHDIIDRKKNKHGSTLKNGLKDMK